MFLSAISGKQGGYKVDIRWIVMPVKQGGYKIDGETRNWELRLHINESVHKKTTVIRLEGISKRSVDELSITFLGLTRAFTQISFGTLMQLGFFTSLADR